MADPEHPEGSVIAPQDQRQADSADDLPPAASGQGHLPREPKTPRRVSKSKHSDSSTCPPRCDWSVYADLPTAATTWAGHRSPAHRMARVSPCPGEPGNRQCSPWRSWPDRGFGRFERWVLLPQGTPRIASVQRHVPEFAIRLESEEGQRRALRAPAQGRSPGPAELGRGLLQFLAVPRRSERESDSVEPNSSGLDAGAPPRDSNKDPATLLKLALRCSPAAGVRLSTGPGAMRSSAEETGGQPANSARTIARRRHRSTMWLRIRGIGGFEPHLHLAPRSDLRTAGYVDPSTSVREDRTESGRCQTRIHRLRYHGCGIPFRSRWFGRSAGCVEVRLARWSADLTDIAPSRSLRTPVSLPAARLPPRSPRPRLLRDPGPPPSRRTGSRRAGAR